MHHSHHFPGCGANHREAKDAIVAVANESFHKAFPLIGRLRPNHGVHWQLCDPNDDALAFRFAFAQPDAGERRIGEHAIRNKPVASAAIFACEIVAYDSEIIFGYVRELGAAGAFSQRPHIWRARLQSAIDANVTASVQFNAGLLKSNSSGVGNAPSRDQDIAAVDALLTGRGAHSKRDLVSRSPKYLKKLGLDKNLNGFVAENAPHLPRHIDVLARHELRTRTRRR